MINKPDKLDAQGLNRFQRAGTLPEVLSIPEVSDLFGRQGRLLQQQRIPNLPPHTTSIMGRLLEAVAALDREIALLKERMHDVFQQTPEAESLMTLPRMGFLLAMVMGAEVGEVHRFTRPQEFTS
jgi:transposase